MTLREAISVCLLLALSQAVAVAQAQAQTDSSMSARLSAERLSDVQPGEYNAGGQDFVLGAYGDKYLMRLGAGRECYVLYADRAGLGGRVLKYDSGATALKVSVWGGITLYTHDVPDGVPATRVSDLPAMRPAAVTMAQLNEALADETRHPAYIARYTPRFTMDPAILSGDDSAHALAFDTLINTEVGLEKLLSTNAGRNAVTRRIDTVRIIEGSKPTIRLSGGGGGLAGKLCDGQRPGGPGLQPRHRLCAGQALVGGTARLRPDRLSLSPESQYLQGDWGHGGDHRRQGGAAYQAQASSEAKTVLAPVLSPIPHAALERLAALHGEASQNANLIFLLRSAVPAAGGLMLMGVGNLALGGGPSMAGDFFWALALFSGIAALLASHNANSAAAFDRAPLSKAAASLRRIYWCVRIALGSGRCWRRGPMPGW